VEGSSSSSSSNNSNTNNNNNNNNNNNSLGWDWDWDWDFRRRRFTRRLTPPPISLVSVKEAGPWAVAAWECAGGSCTGAKFLAL